MICIGLLVCIIQVRQTINLSRCPILCVRQVLCSCVSYDCVNGVRSCGIGYLLLIVGFLFVSQILHRIDSRCCVGLRSGQVSTCGVTGFFNDLFNCFNGRCIWQLICIRLLARIIQVRQTINLVRRPVFCVRQIFCGCVSYDCVDGIRGCRISYLLLIVGFFFIRQILHRINRCRCVSLFGSQVSTCSISCILNDLFNFFNGRCIRQFIKISLLACII
ncbi:hypothetical protein ab3b_01384 [Weissella cibaria]|uniref:Uncharacterized protein n=1 Tax=Weissella cibaria TaxID=137591 RepID=A0A0D1LUS9_9LACO|nr:hypothetical protein ab3b_01384 [Weissella cibaria]